MFTSQFHAIITLGKFPSKTANCPTNTFKAIQWNIRISTYLPSAMATNINSEDAHQRMELPSNFYLTTHGETQKANGDTLDLLLFACDVGLALAETMGKTVVRRHLDDGGHKIPTVTPSLWCNMYGIVLCILPCMSCFSV